MSTTATSEYKRYSLSTINGSTGYTTSFRDDDTVDRIIHHIHCQIGGNLEDILIYDNDLTIPETLPMCNISTQDLKFRVSPAAPITIEVNVIDRELKIPRLETKKLTINSNYTVSAILDMLGVARSHEVMLGSGYLKNDQVIQSVLKDGDHIIIMESGYIDIPSVAKIISDCNNQGELYHKGFTLIVTGLACITMTKLKNAVFRTIKVKVMNLNDNIGRTITIRYDCNLLVDDILKPISHDQGVATSDLTILDQYQSDVNIAQYLDENDEFKLTVLNSGCIEVNLETVTDKRRIEVKRRWNVHNLDIPSNPVINYRGKNLSPDDNTFDILHQDFIQRGKVSTLRLS